VAEDKRPNADYSTPQKTYATYLRAIQANDLQLATKCWGFSGGNASDALDVIVGHWVLAHHLNQAAQLRFGAEGWAVLQEWNGNLFRDDCTDEALQRTLARLKGAQVVLKGDTASLIVKWGEDEPLKKPVFGFTGDDPLASFRKVEGAWKIDANAETGLERPADFFKPGTWGPMLRDIQAIERQLITEIEKGKLRTAEGTIAAFETKLDALNDKYDPGWRDRESTKRAAAQAKIKVPSATDVPSLSSTHCQSVAIADSGIVYAVWLAKGQEKALLSPELPPIPKEFAFGPHPDPTWSEVPGVTVCREGKWSRPGVLLEGLMDCSPSFAWCEGEKLHLLVTGTEKKRTHHLLFDPGSRQWTKLAELPHRLGGRTAFRVIGNTVHAAFWEKEDGCYLRYDGSAWSKPLRFVGDKLAGEIRMAADRSGVVYLAWWSREPGRGIHRYVVVRDGKVNRETMTFDKAPIDSSEFDLGIAPKGRVLVAYKADLPKEHPDAQKVHVRYRAESGWSEPEKIDGEGEALHGNFRVVGNDQQALVSWTQNESYYGGRGVLCATFRRQAITDGKSWSPARWIAREPTLRGNGRPVGGMFLRAACVDKNGGVHMAWDACSYCLTARLGPAPIEAEK